MMVKDKIKYFFLTFFLIISSILYVGNSSFINEGSLNVDSIQINEGGKAVCYNKNTGKKYTALKKALDTAERGQSIYVIPGSHIFCDNTLEIKENVSLYVPYKDELYDISSDSEIKTSTFIDTNSTNVKNNKISSIIMINGADIIINSNANLYLGAIFGQRGINGLYTEITLCEDSSIECSGNFYCYGYIKEASYTNNAIKLNSGINSNQIENQSFYNNEMDANRFLYVKSGGQLYSAIAIHDMPSTGNVTTYKDNGVCPMNVVEFPNLQTYSRFDYGCYFFAILRLVLGSSTLYYTKEAPLIINKKSDSDPAMFKLNSGYVAFEYCPDNTSYTSYTGKLDESPTRIYLNGDIYLSGLQFTVKLALSASVDTREMFLPISSKLKIFINNGGVFNSDYDIKFMPGSLVQINKGGTYNNNSSTVVYTSAKFGEIDTSTYPSQMRSRDSSFINNGTLILNSGSHFGGYVSTNMVDSSAQVNLLNVQQSNLKATIPEGINGDNLSLEMSGPFYDEYNTNVGKFLFLAGNLITSYSNSDGLNCWQGNKYAVNSLKIIVLKPYQYNFASYQVYQADDNSGTNQSELTSSAFDSSYNFDLTNGKYFKVVLSGQEESASFTSKPSGSGATFSSGTWFVVSGDFEVTINPSEGVRFRIYVQGVSGAGSTKVELQSSTTQKGSYTTDETFNPSGDHIYKKGMRVKFSVQGGFNSSFRHVKVGAIFRKATGGSDINESTTPPTAGVDGYESYTSYKTNILKKTTTNPIEMSSSYFFYVTLTT